MDAFPKIPEVVGIGFVAIAGLWVLWQIIKLIIKSKDDDQNKLVAVIQNNATAMEKLSKSVDENTIATKAGTEAIARSQQREDFYTRALIETVRAANPVPTTSRTTSQTTSQTNSQTNPQKDENT